MGRAQDEGTLRVCGRRVVLSYFLEEFGLALFGSTNDGLDCGTVVTGVLQLRVDFPTLAFEGDGETWPEK